MPEWLNGTVLKTVIRFRRILGSNPSLSVLFFPMDMEFFIYLLAMKFNLAKIIIQVDV